MIRCILWIGCLLSLLNSVHSQPNVLKKDVKRIVFLGNSITYGGGYIEFIDAYFTMTYPQWEYEIINVGLPSETVSGLSEENHAEGRFPRPDLRERLDRVLAQTQPDLVFSCYGMNDGIYLPFSEKRFAKYRKGIVRLHQKVTSGGAEIIHVTPPIYDEKKGAAYANVLDIYSDWLLSKKYTDDWQVIDIHWPMQKQLEAERLIDPTFAFAKDGIHPSPMGHFEMAKYLITGLGEKGLSDMKDADDLLSIHDEGHQILRLIQKRQRLTKDAWLTATGHKRPGMNEGLPMDEVRQQVAVIDQEIQSLLQ